MLHERQPFMIDNQMLRSEIGNTNRPDEIALIAIAERLEAIDDALRMILAALSMPK